jgi:predicted TIM-barrel fold metal-dependent hydrolase
MTTWVDVDSTVAHIEWSKEAGFKGVVLPHFDPNRPLYHPDFEPIWSSLEKLELIVNSHGGASSTTNVPIRTVGAPYPGYAVRLNNGEAAYMCHNILPHMIWGGAFERHPGITMVFTEQTSGWVLGMLQDMDYAYTGSYLRCDVRDVIKNKPSDYYRRQCYMGASTFSCAEVAARHEIGLNQMMIGMDYPHHEGTIAHGSRA